MKAKRSQSFTNLQPKIAGSVAFPKVKRVLTTTDFSEAARSGVRYAVRLSEKLGAAVTLLHVIEPPSRLSGVESVILAREDTAVAALARKQLAALAKLERKGNLTVALSTRSGKAFNEITAAAVETEADLIVIATHGYTGVEHVLLGSTAERVVRHAPCSVLTVPAQVGKVPPFRLQRILVPMDFSARSKAALTWAMFLAAQFEAEVVLFHVVEKFPIDYLLGRELTSHAIIPLIKQAEADLERAAADLTQAFGLKISASVREGRPHEAICNAAQALAVDLIVLTTHGYTGLKHVWLGSTAERVVRHAHCPGLVVRAAKPRA